MPRLFFLLRYLAIGILSIFLVIMLLPSTVGQQLALDPASEVLLAQHRPSTLAPEVLVLDLLDATPLQQHYLFVTWISGDQRPRQLVLPLRSSSNPQQVLVPLGAYSGWSGAVRELRVSIPYQGQAEVLTLLSARLEQRSPWDLSMLVSRWLAPVLPMLPTLAMMQSAVAALLLTLIALLLPWKRWPQRMGLAGIGIALLFALTTLISQGQVLAAVHQSYGGLSQAQAVARAPNFELQPQALAQLFAAAEQLPDGPMLLLDVRPESDLLRRVRYHLLPRQVDRRSPHSDPTAIPELLAAGYVAAIQADPTDAPPAPGWQRVDLPDGPLAIWQAPDAPPAPQRPLAAGMGAFAALIAGAVLLSLVGWLLAGALGWRGSLRWGASLSFGSLALTWWMLLLDLVNLPWSWLSVGLPLLAVAGVAWWQRRTAVLDLPSLVSSMAPLHRGLLIAGWLLIGLLSLATLYQTMLLPFADRDTWAMWGLKGQAFYLDGEIARILHIYRETDLHHSSYPPLQPLSQTWLYLAMGGLHEQWVKLLFPLWYLTGLLIVWWMARRWLAPLPALGWVLLLATTPLYLDHATLANADLPLAVTLLLGGVGLIGWMENADRRWLIGAVLGLAAAAWIKLDGLYLGVGMIGAAVLAQAISHWRKPAALRSLFITGALAIGGLVALILPWLIATQLLQFSDIPSLESHMRSRWELLIEGLTVIIAEVLFSYNNSSMGLLGGGYGAFWWLILGASVLGWRRWRHDPLVWFLGLSVLGGFAMYLAVYTVRPYSSIERYLLHLAPLAVLLAARLSLGAWQPAPEPVVAKSSARQAQKKAKRRH